MRATCNEPHPVRSGTRSAGIVLTVPVPEAVDPSGRRVDRSSGIPTAAQWRTDDRPGAPLPVAWSSRRRPASGPAGGPAGPPSGPRLQLVGDEGVVVLNDRRVPEPRSTIKLIAVGPAGRLRHRRQALQGTGPHQAPRCLRPARAARAPRGPPELHAVARPTGPPGRRSSGPAWTGPRGGRRSRSTAMLCLTRAEWGLASSALVARRLGRVAPADGRRPGLPAAHGLTRGAGGGRHHRGPAARRLTPSATSPGPVAATRPALNAAGPDRPPPASSTRPPGNGRAGRAPPERSGLLGLGDLAQPPGPAEAGPHPVVPGRPDVQPAQGAEEEHLGRPGPDAAHLGQVVDHVLVGQPARCVRARSRPSATWSARSRMEAALARLSPDEASTVRAAASTASGVTEPPIDSTKRPWMVAAARPASCW